MENLAISPQTIEQANQKLGALIHSIGSAQTPPAITAETMSGVVNDVVRIGEWLRAGGAQTATAECDGGLFSEELDRYRQLLEHLREVLPDLHAHLLTERTRLESERLHLDSAAAWARSATRHAR